MKRNIIILLASLFVFTNCEDNFEPNIENFKDLDTMYADQKYAMGILTTAYRYLPDGYPNIEYATDDAVTNERGHRYLEMATGSWTAQDNPIDMWVAGYGAIQYLNIFLERSDDIVWAEDPEVSELLKQRMRGEAYGLRGIFLYYILRNHAGYSPGGELLGVPILTEFQDANADFNTSRPTFQETVNQIMDDLNKAIDYLPLVYDNSASMEEIPDKFEDDVTTVSSYNRAMGNFFRQRVDGLIAMAFRSKVAMLSASPAFQEGSTLGWRDAAIYSADVLNYIGGVAGLAPNGHTYYTNTAELDGLQEGINPAEILWRTNISTTGSAQEETHLPPSLFGNGRMNPTQNLIEVFPMSDGYPITHPLSSYDPTDPFVNRDPRLSNYIVYNGSTLGVNNMQILTGSASGTDDAINNLETSTRTGYYMKKRLRLDINFNNADGSWQGKITYVPRVRFTEIFLNYAEAANEAYGPTGTAPNSNYSAIDVIRAIRERALGVTSDPYLDEASNSKEMMRELIRNERRLELSFEGFRFWDLRRWEADLNVTAEGYDASTGQIFDVEPRTYADHMNYGPIPFSEVLKYNNLIQNRGW
ncbi:RagB/SusD family nutrient uptake outer membrane protein [Autumnicola musiva]|uniref:RagB/SusD family nutrient uptake outer membrane protein n=1 Tax=Autumnicola musiva TaxID=3075589 RepID=A0ABU3D4T7_9FLAO|nr:RagB/SusD family nutrient uptake outer membrane protein [Zunongwangia sp. F117]MDT0676541.1 RagB/SusD family nutrient uptake outer membrane protein [Zunongwangia sp. F117]